METSPEQHVEALARLCAAHPGVRRVLLFGSRARGDAAPRADIDLALEVDDDVDWIGLWDAVETYPTLLKIDLVRLPPDAATSDDRFVKAVLRDAKVLHERA